MKINKIVLSQFRNYSQYEYVFPEDKSIILLLGKNGRGKTNFLEAIYTLSLGRSFRTSNFENLVAWENDYARINADVNLSGDNQSLESFFSCVPRRQKVFKRNDIKVKHQEFLGNLLTVLFHPEDLNMLYLSPSLRRKYLDTTLSQTDKAYLESLSNYKKTLKQRNSLLAIIRDKKFKSENIDSLLINLDIIDLQIIEYGRRIIEKRLVIIDFLKKSIEKIYQDISKSNESIDINYITKLDLSEIESSYYDKFQQRRDLEILKAKTIYGPHLDDIEFKINGHLISKSASRGEFRTLLLAIKLAEIEFIKEYSGHYPILLLDDVFSELDLARQEHFLKSIENCQTIITATENFLKSNDNVEIVDI